MVEISKEEEKKLYDYLVRMEEAVGKQEDLPEFIKEQIVSWKGEIEESERKGEEKKD